MWREKGGIQMLEGARGEYFGIPFVGIRGDSGEDVQSLKIVDA